MKKSIFGMLLMLEAIFLFVATGVSLWYNYTEGEQDVYAMGFTTALTFMSALVLMWAGRYDKEKKRTLSRGDNLMIVALTWAIFSVFGCIPFLLYDCGVDVAGAYFETMSGFSTSGATVLTNIDSLPHGLLFWRSITQWMGGLGIVVFSFALIPVNEFKNANMFQAEVTGISLDKLTPKIGATARRLLLIYIILTLICALLYWAGPMNLYDAINHSMTTIATGGYSTHGASLGYFHSSYVEYVASFFMVVSSINFSLFYFISIGRGKVFFRNEEMHAFLQIVLATIVGFILLFYFAPIHHHSPEALRPEGFWQTLRTAVFHVSTCISSTGFQGETFDYVGWGASFWMLSVFIMAIGGCAGSTAGGMKVIRLLIYVKVVWTEFIRSMHPHALINVRISGKIVPSDNVRRALAYIIMYTLLSIIGIFVFTMLNIDVDSSIGACISSLSNVGPGTGIFGPASTYASMPAAGKWLLSFYMLVGRLEIFTVLYLFLPSFWRKHR